MGSTPGKFVFQESRSVTNFQKSTIKSHLTNESCFLHKAHVKMIVLLPGQQHIIFLCGVPLFVHDTQAEDEALLYVVSSSDIFSRSKKNWHSYTKSFLAHVFSCFIGSSNINFLTKGLYLFLKSSQKFTTFKTSRETYSSTQRVNRYSFANYRFDNDSDLFQKNFDKLANKNTSISLMLLLAKHLVNFWYMALITRCHYFIMKTALPCLLIRHGIYIWILD